MNRTRYAIFVTVIAVLILFFIPQAAAAVSSAASASQSVGSTFQDCPDCPQMTVVPAGRFLMGSSDEELKREIEEVPENLRAGISHLTLGVVDYLAQEQPQHLVTIPQPFALGTYPVSSSEFAAFVHETGYAASKGCGIHAAGNSYKRVQKADWQAPGFEQSGRDPVVCVSWLDIRAYVDWLNSKVGGMGAGRAAITAHYRLPSEAEWEYAARAGTRTARWWGDAVGHNNADCIGCGSVWDRKSTAPVGSFEANPFGLYDMIGNVFEWTNDCWNERYRDAPADGQPWISGDCDYRIRRGGSWKSDFWTARTSSRLFGHPSEPDNLTGFRVAKTIMSN